MNRKKQLVRLDRALVERGLAPSRTQAQSLIEEGAVRVGGIVAHSAASRVATDAPLEVDLGPDRWVSRGAYKLLKALDVFGVSPQGRECLDVGASTGGFTEVLLAHGASRVTAVDVGYGQLAWKLRSDPRVVVRERMNARNLTLQNLPAPPSLAVCDASFISLRLLLGVFDALLAPGGELIALVKPQFEVGREDVGNGVVTAFELHVRVLEDVRRELACKTSLALLGSTWSPVKGPKGNIEFLYHAVKIENASDAPSAEIDLATLVREAHEALCES